MAKMESKRETSMTESARLDIVIRGHYEQLGVDMLDSLHGQIPEKKMQFKKSNAGNRDAE